MAGPLICDSYLSDSVEVNVQKHRNDLGTLNDPWTLRHVSQNLMKQI